MVGWAAVSGPSEPELQQGGPGSGGGPQLARLQLTMGLLLSESVSRGGAGGENGPEKHTRYIG